MYDDDLINRWSQHALAAVPDASLFDMHTHVGWNDPDGFKMYVPDLLAELEVVRSRAVVIPMHEPDGYPPANDYLLEQAAASGGTLVPFCRLNPSVQPLVEARRCVDAGARGLKLHPRAEQFDLADEAVNDIFAFAHERRLPILIHAGRGIPALAQDALRLADRYPDARVILAHCAISDLSWIWRELEERRNVFIDTAWWSAADQLTMFALVPPSNLLYASDLPYMTPALITGISIRIGLQVGLSAEQMRGILGGQAERLLTGDELLDLGPAPGYRGLNESVHVRRVGTWLSVAVGRMVIGDAGYEPLSLARLACDVGDDNAPGIDILRNVIEILDFQEQFAREHPDDGPLLYPGARSIMLAAALAVTPDVPLPPTPGLESAEELRRRTAIGHRPIEATHLAANVSIDGDLRRSSAADHLGIDPGDVRRSYSTVHTPTVGAPDIGTGDVLGGYRLEHLIGEGGMGKVYRATATVDDRQVAVKVLRAELSDDESFARFEREARAGAEVRHPNLTRVLDVGEADGRHYLVLEYVDGESLESRITREGRLPLETVLQIVSQIAPALDELHAHGLFHRDLKASNILLDRNDIAFVTDFGLAKGEGYAALTQPGHVVGTLDYLAPELVQGEAATAASDVYALGCIVFECLTGKPPFADKEVTRVAVAHLSEAPPDITERAGVPAAVSAAVLSALEKDPDKRPGTAGAYITALRAASEGV